MAKYVNTQTGLEIAATYVRELTPGSGIYVNFAPIAGKQLVTTPPPRGGEGHGHRYPALHPPGLPPIYPGGTMQVNDIAVQQVGAFVAVIDDSATYDPIVDNPIANAINAAIRRTGEGK